MIGSLDPLDILSGVQGRLWNLGIDCGPVDNIIGPLTKAGVRTFQKIAFAESREWDGIPGKKTQGKLREHHEV
jgi:N-acetylmuramoyl-L-alanine amidase